MREIFVKDTCSSLTYYINDDSDYSSIVIKKEDITEEFNIKKVFFEHLSKSQYLDGAAMSDYKSRVTPLSFIDSQKYGVIFYICHIGENKIKVISQGELTSMSENELLSTDNFCMDVENVKGLYCFQIDTGEIYSILNNFSGVLKESCKYIKKYKMFDMSEQIFLENKKSVTVVSGECFLNNFVICSFYSRMNLVYKVETCPNFSLSFS